jgi:hypothetical protein
MDDTESLRQVAHSRAPLSAWFGIVLLFMLFGAVVLAVIGPAPRQSNYEETRAKKRVDNLKTLREETQKALTTYGWVDKNKGVARIPIDRAMELTVGDLAQQKPAPAGPIATPEAQAPAASASPAPAGSPPKGNPSPARSPSTQPPVAPSPMAAQPPPTTASPLPAKTP